MEIFKKVKTVEYDPKEECPYFISKKKDIEAFVRWEDAIEGTFRGHGSILTLPLHPQMMLRDCLYPLTNRENDQRVYVILDKGFAIHKLATDLKTLEIPDVDSFLEEVVDTYDSLEDHEKARKKTELLNALAALGVSPEEIENALTQ